MQSVPVTPAQPNKPVYPVSALYLFAQFNTPEAYQAAAGEAPPTFDPTKRPKNWFDSSVDLTDPAATVVYSAYRLSKVTGGWSYTIIAMSAAEAASVNLIPDGIADSMPGWEVPARALLPNEVLQPTIGNVLEIRRTDLSVDDGRFSQADRDILNRIAEKLGA